MGTADLSTEANETINLEGNLCSITVGRKSKTAGNVASFTVHEELLRQRSSFFEAALSKSWLEKREGVVKLPDADPDTVRKYLHYLYRGNIVIPSTSLAPGAKKGYTILAKLYVLGEYVQDKQFRKAVLDEVITRIVEVGPNGARSYPPNDTVATIYSGTTAGSPARKLMVDCHVTMGHATWLSDEAEMYHKDFLLDLARAGLGLGPKTNFDVGDLPSLKRKFAEVEK
ncbi:hypothetical protein LTR95_000498 [Oleoguttula sp. CCFEE 5521]